MSYRRNPNDRVKFSSDEVQDINRFIRSVASKEKIPLNKKPNLARAIFLGKRSKDLSKTYNSEGATLADLAVKNERDDILSIIKKRHNTNGSPVFSSLTLEKNGTPRKTTDSTSNFGKFGMVVPPKHTARLAEEIQHEKRSLPIYRGTTQLGHSSKSNHRTRIEQQRSLPVYNGVYV